MRLRLGAAILIALIVPYTAAAAVSVSMPVPVDVQAALFRNIWKLDRNFDSTKAIKLAVVYQEGFADSVAAKDDFLASISRQGLRITILFVEAGTQQLLSNGLHAIETDIVYVAPLRGVDVTEIGRISRFHRFRTITGVPEYVDLGLAVGIGLRRDRPLIIVNLEQARAEGAVFSSQLLALARIVGPVQ
jgi:hypothetical protein